MLDEAYGNLYISPLSQIDYTSLLGWEFINVINGDVISSASNIMTDSLLKIPPGFIHGPKATVGIY